MFNNEINQLTEELQYHRSQVEEIQTKLEEVKICEAFGSDAIDKVKGAIEQIGVGKYLWLFKEELLSMFPATYASQEVEAEQPPVYLEEKQEVEEAPVEVKTEVTEEVKSEKSYYELTGRPDLRPTTYEDLAPNVSYSSSGRAYVGFNDRKEAEEFRDAISEPSLLDDAVIMNGFKYEVKFHCSREYVQEVANSINSMSPLLSSSEDGAEDIEPQQANLEKIDGEIMYSHQDSIVYIAGKNKGRLNNYGSYLTRILDIGEKYTVSKDPQIVDAKYELRIEGISFEDTLELQNFNLKKEWDAKENKDARSLWRTTRKREVEPACKPLDKLVPLDEVKLGSIVYLNSIDNQYKVLAHKELDSVPHIEVLCVFNSERPSLVSEISYLKECYLVPSDQIQIDSQFEEQAHLQRDEALPLTKEEEQEEVLTETVAVYKPKEKPVLKKVKNEELTENDFPAGPYQKISLDEIEVCDIVTTNPHSRSAYEVRAHKGDHVLAVCLYNLSLPNRVGEEFYFKVPYLIEKADFFVADEATEEIITAA